LILIGTKKACILQAFFVSVLVNIKKTLLILRYFLYKIGNNNKEGA